MNELGLSNSTNEDRKRANELVAQYINLEEAVRNGKEAGIVARIRQEGGQADRGGNVACKMAQVKKIQLGKDCHGKDG